MIVLILNFVIIIVNQPWFVYLLSVFLDFFFFPFFIFLSMQHLVLAHVVAGSTESPSLPLSLSSLLPFQICFCLKNHSECNQAYFSPSSPAADRDVKRGNNRSDKHTHTHTHTHLPYCTLPTCTTYI